MSKLVLTLIDEVNCHLDGLDAYDVEKIIEATKYPDPKAFMTAAFQTGNWDGKVSLFDEETHIFFQHMLDDVMGTLERQCGYNLDTDVEFVDERRNQDLTFSDIKPVEPDFFGDLLPFAMRDYQVNGINQSIQNQKGILEYGTSAGKAQPVDEIVLTPDGWVPIGSLKEGDHVIGSNGMPTKVTGVFPQGPKEVYEIEVGDTKRVRASDEHLWSVCMKPPTGPSGEPFTTTTFALRMMLAFNGNGQIMLPALNSFPMLNMSHFSDDEVREWASRFVDTSLAEPVNLPEELLTDKRFSDAVLLEDSCAEEGITWPHMPCKTHAKVLVDLWRLGGLHAARIDEVGKANISPGRPTSSRALTDVKYVGKQECVCISIEAEDRLYVTRDCILTHNTIICAGIAKAVEDRLKTLTVVPSATLLKQTLEEYQRLGLDAKGLTPKVPTKKRPALFRDHQHVVLTRQIALNCGEMFDSSEFGLMYDECFPPDVEVLTQFGFKAFSHLNADDKVAQVDDDRRITFVRPSRHVTKHFDGFLVEFRSKRTQVAIRCTPNHDMVIQQNGGLKKIPARNLQTDTVVWSADAIGSFVLAGRSSVEKGVQLDPVATLALMTLGGTTSRNGDDGWEVDMSHFDDDTAERISDFIRNHRIDAQLDTDSEPVNYIGGASPAILRWYRPGPVIRRLRVFRPYPEWFDDGAMVDLSLISEGNAEAMIEILADFMPVKDRYSNNILINALSPLCDRVAIRPMNLEQYDPVTTSTTLTKVPLQRVDKYGVRYVGPVHCVTVPTGRIIARDGGSPMIIGNCHELGDEFAHFMRTALGDCPLRIGLTGTVPNKKLKRHVLESHIGGPVLDIVSTHFLMENDYVAQSSIEMYSTSHPEMEELSDTKDESTWNWDIEARYLGNHKERIEAIVKFIKSYEPKNTLILCHPDMGRNLAEHFGGRMITDATPLKQREEWFKGFEDSDDFILPASYGTVGTGVSINRIFRMFMIDVGKNEVHIRQGFGRGLRLDGDINRCDVIDISAKTKYSARHKRDRKRILKREKIPFTEIQEHIRVFDKGD